MRYLINRWGNNTTAEVTCMFSTDNLEAWLKAIAEIKKKYHLTADSCRWLKQKENWHSYITVFSFCTVMGRESWLSPHYMKKPEFIFDGFPEGVKYYE